MYYAKRFIFSTFSILLFILMIMLKPIVLLTSPAKRGWKDSEVEPFILGHEENTTKGAIKYFLSKKEFSTILVFLFLTFLLTFYSPTILLVGSYLYSIF